MEPSQVLTSPDGDTRKVYRTAHIHVKVKGPERTTLTTQLYFPQNADGNSRDGFAIDECVCLFWRDLYFEFPRFGVLCKDGYAE